MVDAGCRRWKLLPHTQTETSTYYMSVFIYKYISFDGCTMVLILCADVGFVVVLFVVVDAAPLLDLVAIVPEQRIEKFHTFAVL
jgi:hypothetical protein